MSLVIPNTMANPPLPIRLAGLPAALARTALRVALSALFYAMFFGFAAFSMAMFAVVMTAIWGVGEAGRAWGWLRGDVRLTGFMKRSGRRSARFAGWTGWMT